MDQVTKETLIGAAVVIVGGVLLALSYGGGRSPQTAGYELLARFNKAEGIGVGSDVRLSGVSVGTVVRQLLDEHYRALLTLRLTPGVELPDDSAAVIQTDGLLGAKFLAVQPGAEDQILQAGAEFHYTQDSVDVLDLLALVVAQGEANHAPLHKP
jgi:phospholipid/cholesterol/gamma-HCH transport system substrate-binding protein